MLREGVLELRMSCAGGWWCAQPGWSLLRVLRRWLFRLERIVAAPLSPLRKLGIVWCGVLGLLEWMVGSIDLKVEVAPRERCGAVVISTEPL